MNQHHSIRIRSLTKLILWIVLGIPNLYFAILTLFAIGADGYTNTEEFIQMIMGNTPIILFIITYSINFIFLLYNIIKPMKKEILFQKLNQYSTYSLVISFIVSIIGILLVS